MTALQLYRDDGPLAGWLGRRLAAARVQAEGHPLAWLVPPLLRILEYGSLLALTAAAEPGALPLCFAFLGVLAFHHYDTVYRLRHQRVAPPAWVALAGGGWEVRLLAAALLALAGVLGYGLLVAAAALALVYVGESTLSWIRFGQTGAHALPEDEGEDEEGD